MNIMEYKGIKTFYAESKVAFRNWLIENHITEANLWLIIYKKDSGTPSITYDQAVDEAICFGWIDSTINKRDDESFYQYFAKRKPKSSWSRVNKLKVEKLISEGLMTESGFKIIELAKQTGTWTALDDVENLIIPPDLQEALDENTLAHEYFDLFPRSVKRGVLEWLMNAKQAETRLKRITEIIEKAERNERANQYVKKV
jgi:uncharacterized protein YdeI (YjbR/CyaY-like superfamily)